MSTIIGQEKKTGFSMKRILINGIVLFAFLIGLSYAAVVITNDDVKKDGISALFQGGNLTNSINGGNNQVTNLSNVSATTGTFKNIGSTDGQGVTWTTSQDGNDNKLTNLSVVEAINISDGVMQCIGGDCTGIDDVNATEFYAGTIKVTVPCSCTVAQDNTGTYNGSTDVAIVQCINATTQSSSGCGKVCVKEGVYNITDTLKVDSCITLEGVGIDATILRLGAGVQKTVVEMANNSTITKLTVDGNYQNNLQGEGGWATIDNVPFAQGIYTSLSTTNGAVFLSQHDIIVKDVKVINTLRSNIVLSGEHVTVDTVYLKDSYTDHLLYVTATNKSYANNIHISGKANSEAIVIGTSAAAPVYDTVVSNIWAESLSAGKLGFPAKVVSCRYNSGDRNRIENVYAKDNNATQGIEIFVGHLCQLKNINIERRGSQYEVLYINASGVTVDGFNLKMTAEDRTSAGAIVRVRQNNVRLKNGNISASGLTWWRGIQVEPYNNISNLVVEDVDIDTPTHIFRIDATGLAVNYTTNRVQALNVKTSLNAGTITRFGCLLGACVSEGTVDMNNRVMTNIGSADTDFTSDGGLNLASNLTIGSASSYKGINIFNETGGAFCVKVVGFTLTLVNGTC